MKSKFSVLFVVFCAACFAQNAMPDEQFPAIIIEQLKDGQTVNTAQVAVTGKVTAPAGKNIAAVLINDEAYPVSLSVQAGFNRKVKLNEGENKIVVEAEDTDGALARKVLTIIYSKDAPVVEQKEIKKEETKTEKPPDAIPENTKNPAKKKKIQKFVASIDSVKKNKVTFYAGKADGLSVGDVVAIRRGKEIIGKIKVTDVSATKSTGEIFENNESVVVDENDTVVP